MPSPDQCGLSEGEEEERNGQNLVPFFRCIFSPWGSQDVFSRTSDRDPVGGVESGTGAGRKPLSRNQTLPSLCPQCPHLLPVSREALPSPRVSLCAEGAPL